MKAGSIEQMGAALQGRRQWKEDQAKRVLDAWGNSGQSAAAFAKRLGITPQRLSWWRKRLGAEEGAEATWVPVTVRWPERGVGAAAVLVTCGARIEVDVLDAASAAWIASVVRALAS